MRFQLLISASKRSFPKKMFKELTDLTLAHLKQIPPGKFVISLCLCDDEISKQTNEEFRKINAPTDVIALCYTEKKELRKVNAMLFQLGSIFINLDQVSRQIKKENAENMIREVALLYVHGLLHLFHYDHRYYAEKKKMFALQEKIISEGFIQ